MLILGWNKYSEVFISRCPRDPFTGSVPDADDTYFYAGATTLP